MIVTRRIPMREFGAECPIESMAPGKRLRVLWLLSGIHRCRDYGVRRLVEFEHDDGIDSGGLRSHECEGSCRAIIMRNGISLVAERRAHAGAWSYDDDAKGTRLQHARKLTLTRFDG